MKSNRYFCQIIMKIEFSGQIFEKYLYFLKNPSGGSFSMRMDGRTVGHTDRETDRHDEANGRFSQFFERA